MRRSDAIEVAARALIGAHAKRYSAERVALVAALALPPDAPAEPSERERTLVRRGYEWGPWEEPLTDAEIDGILDSVNATHPRAASEPLDVETLRDVKAAIRSLHNDGFKLEACAAERVLRAASEPSDLETACAFLDAAGRTRMLPVFQPRSDETDDGDSLTGWECGVYSGPTLAACILAIAKALGWKETRIDAVAAERGRSVPADVDARGARAAALAGQVRARVLREAADVLDREAAEACTARTAPQPYRLVSGEMFHPTPSCAGYAARDLRCPDCPRDACGSETLRALADAAEEGQS